MNNKADKFMADTYRIYGLSFMMPLGNEVIGLRKYVEHGFTQTDLITITIGAALFIIGYIFIGIAYNIEERRLWV